MTQDVRIIRKDSGLFDLNVVSKQFETISGFETAIIISLFTDARAPASAVPSPSRRRGWPGDILTVNEGLQLGSRLWMYEQSRLTDATLNDISVAANECLQWLLTTTPAKAKAVAANAVRNGVRDVTINVSITTIQGKEERYAVLWRRTGDIV